MDLEFGKYRFKRQERQLLGPNGPVELSSRSFDILTVLLDKPNELIGKSAILDSVWPGVAVEENTLQVHISALRKALGPDLIVTVQGRGYKYAGPHPLPVGSAPAASHLPTLEGKPIIVVLPFENLSSDANQQYFSDGVAGEITDRLARFRKFAVIGKHSSAAFRGATPDFSAVREKLKADFVVTGSVRRSEARKPSGPSAMTGPSPNFSAFRMKSASLLRQPSLDNWTWRSTFGTYAGRRQAFRALNICCKAIGTSEN